MVFITFPNDKVVFKPCQHMPACPSCAASLTGCPQCGAEVEEKIVKPGLELAIALELELACKHILRLSNLVFNLQLWKQQFTPSFTFS